MVFIGGRCEWLVKLIKSNDSVENSMLSLDAAETRAFV